MSVNKENPDILDCLCNLSSDEVFTSPRLANEVLDGLPKEIFKNKDTKILDPGCKSGVFLREAAKRFDIGLKDQIPDDQERTEWIMKNCLYGIATTELCALMSRRTLYCSSNTNSKNSICNFNNGMGNIYYDKNFQHTFENKKCKYCGANEDEYDGNKHGESYAYWFIHQDKKTIQKEINKIFGGQNMKFDVIITNPPYQLDDGAESNSKSASPLYDKFVILAKELNPTYISMIIPSRYMNGGKGLTDFRKNMLEDNHISYMRDFLDAHECFPTVEIKGGVQYFLYNKNYNSNIIKYNDELKDRKFLAIRDKEGSNILEKVSKLKEKKITDIISSRKPYGFPAAFRTFSNNGTVKIHYLDDNKDRKIALIDKQLLPKSSNISKYKVLLTAVLGNGHTSSDKFNPFIAKPNECCTETYIEAGSFETINEAESLMSYINTKFFHYLLGLKKYTQNISRDKFSLIPAQTWDRTWTDQDLYKKYKLTQSEIDYIEKVVWSDRTDNNK